MITWSNKDRTCKTLYEVLVDAGQLSPITDAFDAAGAYTMSQLLFFNAAASSDIQSANVEMLASKIDSELADGYNANYKTPATSESSIAAITDILSSASKTITDLADVVSINYSIS